MSGAIVAIEYHLPENQLSNQSLVRQFPEWTEAKVASKIGIKNRSIVAADETASDIAVIAAQKLFATGVCTPSDIDFVLLCTQSPDYFLPTTACLIQERLGLPTSVGALDFNLGCSGYIYGLGLAKGLIETSQAQRVLLLTAETYSKYLDPHDKSSRALFGDAAAATLIQFTPATDDKSHIGPFVWGTDGRGAQNLIVEAGGTRRHTTHKNAREHLYMNGPEIFTFTLRVVPEVVVSLLEKAQVQIADIDLFVFHQANSYMLEHLRKKLQIASEKFVVWMENCGNTVSSTIPIGIKEAHQQGMLRNGSLIMLVGFGVGYSWGATLVRWTEASDALS